MNFNFSFYTMVGTPRTHTSLIKDLLWNFVLLTKEFNVINHDFISFDILSIFFNEFHDINLLDFRFN